MQDIEVEKTFIDTNKKVGSDKNNNFQTYNGTDKDSNKTEKCIN